MARKIILSDETTNSKGFVVKTDGIHLGRFLKNPVMLELHDPKVILGKWINIKVEDGKLMAEPLFNEGNDHAKSRKQEFEGEFLNAASAGLRPMGIKFVPEDFDFSGDVPVLLRSQLMEGSLVPIPSNENALGLYDGGGNLITDVEAMITEIKLSAQSSSHLNINDMEFKKQLAVNLGLSENASDAEILAAQSAQSKKIEAIELSIQTAKKDRAAKLIEKAIADKKIKPEQKDTYLLKAEADYDFVELTLSAIGAPAAATPEKKLADYIKENDKGGAGADLAEARKGWGYMDWLKNAPTELKLMEKDTPDVYNALLDAHRKAVQEKNKA